MATKPIEPIDSVILQALLRATGPVLVKEPAEPDKGVWNVPWFLGPLAETKNTLRSKEGRLGIERALGAGKGTPRPKGLLSLRADENKTLEGLGTWLQFHEKLPLDLVLVSPADNAPGDPGLDLGFGVRVLDKDKKLAFVARAMIAQVAGPDLAALRKPITLEVKVPMPSGSVLTRLGLAATYDKDETDTARAFEGVLSLADAKGKEFSVAFPRAKPEDSFLIAPLKAALVVCRAFIVSRALKAVADNQPQAISVRLEQHLFPLIEGDRGVLDPLPISILGGQTDGLLAWLKKLNPVVNPGGAALSAAAIITHLRDLLFPAPPDKPHPAVADGSKIAWLHDGGASARIGLWWSVDWNFQPELGLIARFAKSTTAGQPSVSFDLRGRLLGLDVGGVLGGEVTVARPAIVAALTVKAAPATVTTTGDLESVELGLALLPDRPLAPHLVLRRKDKPALSLDRDADRGALLVELKALATSTAQGVWDELKAIVTAWIGDLQSLTIDPAKFLELLGTLRTQLGITATGPLELPGGFRLALGAPTSATPLAQRTLSLTSSPTSGLGCTIEIKADPATTPPQIHAQLDVNFDLTVMEPAAPPVPGEPAVTLKVGAAFGVAATATPTGLVFSAKAAGRVTAGVSVDGVTPAAAKALELPLTGQVPDLGKIASDLLWPLLRALPIPTEVRTLIGETAPAVVGGKLDLQPWPWVKRAAELALGPSPTLSLGGGLELKLLSPPGGPVALELSGLDLEAGNIRGGISNLKLGLLSATNQPDFSLGGTVSLAAGGTTDGPLFSNDFVGLDRIDTSARFDVFPTPKLEEVRVTVYDLRLPFGGMKKDPKVTGPQASDGNSVEGGLLQTDGNNPGLSIRGQWTAPGNFKLEFPPGNTGVPRPDNSVYFAIDRRIGPLDVEGLTVRLIADVDSQQAGDQAAVGIAVKGGFQLGPVEVRPEGLGLTIPLLELTTPQSWKVTLDGLALSFQSGDVTLAGRFAKVGDGYEGDALVSAYGFSLGAIGAYQKVNGDVSLFVFAFSKTPLGGPPFFFVTGVAGGFGINRMLERPTDPKLVGKNALMGLMRGTLQEGRQGLSKLGYKRGSMWFAGGVNFVSFGFIKGQALLYVLIDQGFELGVLALAEAGVENLAQIRLGISAGFTTRDVPTLWATAAIFDSWLVFPSCELTGGFALQVWPTLGDMVVTIGGYGPLYKKPARYPQVDLLGLRWQPSSALLAKGGVYFALTPREMMAGATIEISGVWGPISAYLGVDVHGLIGWDPFRIEMLAGITVRGGFGSLQFEVGVRLYFHAPPVGGNATVKLVFVSVDIPFGSDVEPKRDPIPVLDFLRRHLTLPPPDNTSTPTVRHVFSQRSLWGGDQPTLLSLAVASGGGRDEKKALPTHDRDAARVLAEPVLELRSKLPIMEVVDGNDTPQTAPFIGYDGRQLYLSPSEVHVGIAKLRFVAPTVRAGRPLRFSIQASRLPLAMFGPVLEKGVKAESDVTTPVPDRLVIDARAEEKPVFLDVPRGVEPSDGQQLMLLPFVWWSGGTTLTAVDTSLGALARPATSFHPRVGQARWAITPAGFGLVEPLAVPYKPLRGKRVRNRWPSLPPSPVPKAVGVAMRTVRWTPASLLADARTTLRDHDHLRRVAAPTPAPRSARVALLVLHDAGARPIPAPIRPRVSTARVHAELFKASERLGAQHVVMPPPGGNYVSALMLDGASRLALGAGEVALLPLVVPGSDQTPPWTVVAHGDQRVRIVALDGRGAVSFDQELEAGASQVHIPAGARRVAAIGLGRGVPRDHVPLERTLASGWGPSTELIALGRGVWITPGGTLRVTVGRAHETAELGTRVAGEVLRGIGALSATFPGGPGVIVATVGSLDAKLRVARGLEAVVDGVALDPTAAVAGAGVVHLLYAVEHGAHVHLRISPRMHLERVVKLGLSLETVAARLAAQPAATLEPGLDGPFGASELSLEISR